MIMIKKATLRTALFASLLLLLAVMIGCGISQKKSDPASEKQTETQQQTQQKDQTEQKETSEKEEKTQVVLYFATPDARGLKAEKREITKVSGIAKAALEELIKGPRTPGLSPTLPTKTRILGINIKDGTATVDFSREIREGVAGSAGEQLAIFSVVNTLTEFPTIKRVQFLIEGEKIETLAGHADLSQPITRNEALIIR
ncbi:MAG: germination protein [Eubacteriales bacterium]|nr:germination protein [Eubacteriales bacterium]MDN5363811.1 germination protein [Eubacteriales bacterium]